MKIIRQRNESYVSVKDLAKTFGETKDELNKLEAENNTMKIHIDARVQCLNEIIELLESINK